MRRGMTTLSMGMLDFDLSCNESREDNIGQILTNKIHHLYNNPSYEQALMYAMKSFYYQH